MIQYIMHKDFTSSLQKLGQQGGESKRIADKVWVIWGKAQGLDGDPFHGVPLTNHGESRIRHARKYDLGNGHRLITIHDRKYCMFCFTGNHQSCDSWLNRNTGLTLVKDNDGQYSAVFKSIDFRAPEQRATAGSDYVNVKLYERLEKNDQSRLFTLLPPQILSDFLQLTTMSTDTHFCDCAMKIEDRAVAGVLYDVLIALRAGDRNQAVARMDLHFGVSIPVDQLSEEEIFEINDGMTIKKVKIGSEEYKEWFKKFINSSGYQDWMLFMHPAQQKIVDASFEGAAKLSGVSGSGKTCIVVNRAIRLAKEITGKPVLVLTLNKSLAALIQDLLDYACPDQDVRQRIKAISFFELCQDYLSLLEPDNVKLHNDVTWKNNEHIDEIWREYYRCELNNFDAEVLLPLHRSLNSQGIDPEEYIRQEFDWIRSAFSTFDRQEYLKAERTGRAIPLQQRQRELILEGLEGWERKMADVGVIDYLGLSTNLSGHLEKLTPDFGAVLVDEVQDFGTIELKIIRKLVEEGSNDIFLCGDMAQHVLPKQQSFKEANIDIPSARSLKIQRNYRNSREILRAAYEIFLATMQGDVLFDGEIDILDPEYANFSTPKPLVLKAGRLADEVAYAVSYLKELSQNDPNHCGCIAFAGFSILEVKQFADKHDIPVLDGSCGRLVGEVFMSDLEQSKGYEFDTMCILNCRDKVLPPSEMPLEEQFRDSCRFYVAMTRAKKQLIMSYSDEVSPWLDNERCASHFEFDSWENAIYLESVAHLGTPEKLSQTLHDPGTNPVDLPGMKFIYTKHAIGMSLDLQEKIGELVDGLGRSRGDKRVRWASVRSAYEDVLRHPHAKQEFGVQKTARELVEWVSPLLGV